MENTYSTEYMQSFVEAYEFGLNPAFYDFEDMLMTAPFSDTPGHRAGFNKGRQQYELLNGPVSSGIPKNILSEKMLEQFMIDGIIGMNLDYEGYTDYQLHHITKWYSAGTTRRDYKYSFLLEHSLSQLGVALS